MATLGQYCMSINRDYEKIVGGCWDYRTFGAYVSRDVCGKLQ